MIYKYHLIGRTGYLIDFNIYSAHKRALRIAKKRNMKFSYIEKKL